MEELTTIKELESQIKVSRFFYFYDIAFIVIYVFCTSQLKLHIHSKLQNIYIVNCFIWGLYMILPAVGNSRRKNWQNIINTLYSMFIKPRYTEEKKELEEYDEVK